MTGEEINAFDAYLVFLNGLIVGVHTQPAQLVEKVRQLRRGGRIGEFVSVYLNEVQRAVYIASDGGRVCRPLLVLEAGTLQLLFVVTALLHLSSPRRRWHCIQHALT